VRRLFRAVWAYLQPSPAKELHYYVGLACVAFGMHAFWPPGAPIVVGLGFIYLALSG